MEAETMAAAANNREQAIVFMLCICVSSAVLFEAEPYHKANQPEEKSSGSLIEN
jgi:hypothetical protein